MIILKSYKTIWRYLLYAQTVRVFAGFKNSDFFEQVNDIYSYNPQLKVDVITCSGSVLLNKKNQTIAYNPEYCWMADNFVITIDDLILIIGFRTQFETPLGTFKSVKYVAFEDNISLVTWFNHYFDILKRYINEDKSTQVISQFFNIIPFLKKAVNRRDTVFLSHFEQKLKRLTKQSDLIENLINTIFYFWRFRYFDQALWIIENLQKHKNLPLGPFNPDKHYDYYQNKKNFISLLAKTMNQIKDELENRMFIFSNAQRQNLKDKLLSLLDLKIKALRIKLNLTTDTQTKEKISKLLQEFEAEKNFLENPSSGYQRQNLDFLYKKQLSSQQEAQLRNLYKESMRVIHPDRIPAQHRQLAKDIASVLTQAYNFNDLEAVRTLSKAINNLKESINSPAKSLVNLELTAATAEMIFAKQKALSYIINPISSANSIKEALKIAEEQIETELFLAQLEYEILRGQKE